ncbi:MULTISPECIES: hypothetical protein [unclassified Bradyrhizobium]|uniref:hypothetical protein n=1 Tax=unclassified Bradyrhizobium TaxID=2631580 RepID=UPI001FFB1154|nr:MULTISPECIES: hypothetical protein [unclassified Bradyrhizobium]MCK1356585.1 hypothetical protein [Bradyrhizobium sp. CW7]MCK1566102.1 hypothetical protein [Bradyrhizobium sp. 173]MCK1577718.1 hypothetical protein [Bradyrhizobium sp. 174]
MTFNALTDEQWNAILAVRPDWPRGIDWEGFRKAFEVQGQLYWEQHEGRRRLGTPSIILKHLKTLHQTFSKAQTEMKRLPDHVKHSAPDLERNKQWTQDQIAFYEAIMEPMSLGFSGRSDYYRDMLCEWLMIEWITTLGGELTYSRKFDGDPYGPLIEFLRLSLKAILGKAPGTSGIAKIIDDFRKLS